MNLGYSREVEGDRGRVSRVELDCRVLRENLDVVAAAVSEGSRQTSSEINSLVTGIATLGDQLGQVMATVQKCESDFQALQARVTADQTALVPALQARDSNQFQALQQEFSAINGRLRATEELSLQLAERSQAQVMAPPVHSLTPDEVRRICAEEVQRQLLEFEAALQVRVGQHVEMKVLSMLPQVSVPIREYTSDRAFTESALENLRLGLEDLRVSEKTRDGSVGNERTPPIWCITARSRRFRFVFCSISSCSFFVCVV